MAEKRPEISPSLHGTPVATPQTVNGATLVPSRVKSISKTSNENIADKTASKNGKGRIIKFKTNFRNTIYDTMLRRGWKETSENDWDFYWADREYIYELLDTVHLENGQKVNHYRNGREVSSNK
jgi:hypothetical protein